MCNAISDTNFKDEVLESKIPVLADFFWAEWCGPCSMVAPVLEEIAKKYAGKLKVCKINVDAAPNTPANYNVMSIPTLAIFKRSKLVDKVVGAIFNTELEKFIQPHI